MKKTPQEQARIAKLSGVNDFKLANYGGLQTVAKNEDGQGVESAAVNAPGSSSGSKSTSQASTRASNTNLQHQMQHQEELYDADDDMYNRVFEPGQYIDFW